ncbi:MAG: phosphoribosylglycinamide formyltransferase [Fidelibacterota bacterium]
MLKLAVLGSTRGTDLGAILAAIAAGRLDAAVSVVASNRKSAFILERARLAHIPAIFVSAKDKTREEFDRDLHARLEPYAPDLILLIGFMRILSPWFVHQWEGRIVNVHPSLLPKYAGGMDTNVHEEVLKNHEKETGCTIHLVTEDVDAGPILLQKRCPVYPNDTPETLKARVQQLEGEAFIEVIRQFAKR